MAKNAFNYCPNISLPENKKRIKEIGIDAFYKEYFDTNFSVDLQESNRNIIDYLFVDIDTFSFSMQNEIIDSILYYVDQELNDGTTNVSEVFNNIREAFEGELESFKEVNDDNSLDTYIDIFENVLSHWDSFKDFSLRRLDDLGLKLEKGKQDKPKLTNTENLVEVQEGGLEDPSLVATESDYRRDNYDDSFQFSKSTRDNASGRLKYALARLESEEDNFLGLPKYESLDKVWNKVLTTFAPVLENEIVEKLEALSETDPLFTSLLQKLQADPSGTMINEFVTTFSNQQAGFFTVLLNPTNKGVSSKVFESNRNNAHNVLVADWASNMLSTSLVEEVDGNYKINTEEGARLNQLLEILASPGREISVDQYKSALDNFLKGFGIELSDTTLDSLLTQGVPQGDSFIDIESFANENLRVLVDRVSGKLNNNEADPSVSIDEGESTIDDDFNNPFITETSSIIPLAMAELSKNPFIYESSWITGEGTSRYTYVKNSHLSKTFKLIESESAQRDKFFNNLKKAAFSEHSFWANELNNPSSSFSDNFKLSYLDTIRKENSAYDSGVQFKNMGDIDKALTRIFLFTNQGRGDNGVGVFIPLIPSDKTTIPTIQANKIKVGRNAEGELNIATRKALYNVFISEYNRIKEVQRQEGKFEDKYKLRPEDQIDGYHHGMGNKFVILDFLNGNELLFEKESGRIKDIDNIDIRDIGDLLEDFINHKVNQQKEAWEELGLDIPKVLDNTYKENLQVETDNEILGRFTDDYIINNFIASVNYMQVFYGDPAFLGKSSIDQTWVNIYKRGAKDIAPGSDGNHTSSSYRTLMVSDTEVETKHIKEYTEALTKVTDSGEVSSKIGPYTRMEIADAQEYTTLQEHLAILKAYGKATPEVIQAVENLQKGSTDAMDLVHGLKPLFDIQLGPQKPVQVGFVFDDVSNTNRMFYIKTSSFPLIPGLTKGLEIDKLRQFMENRTDENGNPDPIDRMVYKTGVKEGFPRKAQKAFLSDGSFNTELEDNSIVLDRSIFRIQQEVPHEPSESMTNEASQAKKLLYVDADNNSEILFKGEKKAAKELKDRFDTLHTEKMSRAMDQLLEDTGIEKSSKGDLIVKDISKLQEVLVQEAIERNFNINDLYGLQLIKDPQTGVSKFTIPLTYHDNSAKIESLINSLFTNRVIKQELPGFSAVQGSKIGFERLVTQEDLSGENIDLNQSDVIWIDPKDTTLNYIRANEQGTELLAADILVPQFIKTNSGSYINIKNYIKEDGSLDTNKINPEVLELFGFRIPTQGYNSMMRFKVKGFLPPYVGPLAIVPAEVVAQMGSDFDVDKLFFYRKHYTHDPKTRSINPIEYDYNKPISEYSVQELDNAIVDLYLERLKDPELLEKILEPNSFGQLENLSKEINYLKGENKISSSYDNNQLFPLDQDKVHKANNDGKIGVGIFSLYSVFNRFAQDSELSLNHITVNGRSNLGYTGAEGESSNMIIQYFQSAAVDNANEQILGNLNINNSNMNVVGLLGLLGIDESTISYFTSHPTMVEYSRRLENIDNILSEDFISNTSQSVIIEMLQEMGHDYMKALEIYDNSVNSVMDIKLDKQVLKEQLTSEDTLNEDILTSFIALNTTARHVSKLMGVVGLDTRGLSSSYAELSSISQNILDIASLKEEYAPVDGGQRLLNSPYISSLVNTVLSTWDLYASLFDYGAPFYRDSVHNIRNLVGKINSPLSASHIKKINNFIKSHVINSSGIIHADNVVEQRAELAFDFEDNKSLGTRLEEYFATPKGQKSLLKEHIQIRPHKKHIGLKLIQSINNPGALVADRNSVIAEVYNMFYKGDSTERQLAQDLAKYYILTGGQYNTSSIGRLIPLDILTDEHDYDGKLRDFSRRIQHLDVDPGDGTSYIDYMSVVNQYFQTYPSEAFPFTLGSDDSNAYTKDTSENTVFMNNQNARSLIEMENIEGDIVQDFPRFISRRLEKAGFELYILQNTEEQSTTNPTTQEIEVFQEAKYTRIPTLDLRNFMQNTPNRRLANTLLTKDRVKGFSPSEVKSNSTKKAESPISKPNFNDNTNASMEQLNNWKSQFDLSAPDSIIRTLLEDPSLDSQYKSMLRDILPLISQNNIVFDEAKNHPIAKEILDAVFGVAEGSTVYLNLGKIGIQYNPNDVLAENLIHETLHALTIGKLIADPETLTPNELAHRKRIEALYDTYLKEYAPEQQIERFREIHSKLTSPDKAEREQVPYEDRNFYMKKEFELYPLLNIKEFVAAGLTRKNFREKLEKNNFWQELWAAISDLLGLNIKYENDYAALFDSALGLSNRNDAINFNVSPNTTPLNMSYNERQNKNQLLAQKARETFVNQRQEFLDKYNTEIGKRISEETLERFRNSIKDNPKYNMLSIDSWHGELRVSRKTTQSRPDFNIGGLEEESKLAEIKEILDKPKTPEQRAIEKTVARLVNIRNKFRSSGKAKDNPVIAQKIETISKEIKALKESQSVMKILDDAVTKLDELERKLKNNELSDVLDLEEATRYLGFYKDLENIVQFDVAFDEENSRVRAIASKAANLIEELKLAKLDTVSSYLNNELSIEFDAKEILTTPLIDVTHREQLTQSGQMSSSKAIQLMAALIEKKQIETQMEYNNYIDSMGSIIEAYAKQYRGNYNMFLQKDKNGNNTGYLLNEYSHEYYQELIKRKKNPKEFAKFKRENTKIEITKEDNKRWKEDLEEVKKINPLWEQEGTIDYENFNDFLYTNSPVLYLKRYNAGQDLTGLGRARRYLTETPIEKWRDPSYADLMNLPDSDPAKILYNVLHSEFKAMARKYGNQSNFIPEFNAKYLDSFLKGDIRGGFDKLSEVFKDSFYKTVHPNVKESEVDLDGKPFDTIPVMHMQDTLNPADKDYNLGRVLLLAKQQELANRHKLDIEPYLVMMKELISDLPAHTVNRQSGEIMLDEDNKPKLNTAPDRHFKTMGQINYMMDDYLYGKGSKSSGAVKDWTRSIVTVNSKGETIETTKVFTGSAVGDSINVFTRAKGIFLNPMTGVANGLWGILSNMMLAAERRYFNESTFLRAIGFVISANNLASTRNKKFRNLFNKFHVMKRRSEMNFGKLGVSTTGKPGESFTGFFFDEYAERFIQGTTMVGILMTKKVKALDGTMHSIFDAHDKEGNWNTEKFGEDPFSDVNKRLKIVTEVSTAVGDAHGDYDRSIKIKEGILGRMIMVFRTWIPQSVSKRFGREYEDIYGEVRKGRYRSLLNKDYLTIVPLIKDMYQAYKTDAEQDTVDTRNLRAIGVEMAASAFILTIGMIIRGMLGDMDDEDKEAYYFVLNSMTRLHGDLTFYFNPNSFSSTIREPIPAFKTMMDFIALRKSATDFITGDDEFTTGHRAGRSKFWYNFRKQFPVLNQPEKIENLMKNYFER